MAQKTYYPTFLHRVHELSTYMGQYQASMVQNLGITGTQFATDLATLTTILNTIETTWPGYKELP